MSAVQRVIETLRKEIASLQGDIAGLVGKEGTLQVKIIAANTALAKAKTSATSKLKMSELARCNAELSTLLGRRNTKTKKLAEKQKALSVKENELSKENEKLQKKASKLRDETQRAQEAATRKIMAEQVKLERERREGETRLRQEIAELSSVSHGGTQTADEGEARYDFFISHAHEDKADFVTELAEGLAAAGSRVWYDDFALRVGDSLRRNIDRGLAGSQFGIVVLSTAFFKKEWPQKELDGLFQLEALGSTRILPIWHKVSKDEVAKFSPLLSDKVALNTSTKSLSEIIDDLMQLVIV